jgi:hypothetical protein
MRVVMILTTCHWRLDEHICKITFNNVSVDTGKSRVAIYHRYEWNKQ